MLLRAEVEGRPRRYFRTESWRAIVEDRPDGTHANEATVKLWAKGERIVATAEGNGPVNALDRAIRIGLEPIYPQLAKMQLMDYKVRILEGRHGTESITRVLIATSDGDARMGDRRRRGKRHRRLLAGAGGRVHLRPAPGRPQSGGISGSAGPPRPRGGPVPVPAPQATGPGSSRETSARLSGTPRG